MVEKTKIISLINAIEDYLNNENTGFELLFNEVFEKEDYSKFIEKITKTSTILQNDVNFYLECDPAIDSKDEVIVAYPGYKAIVIHRVAHIIHQMGYKVEARIMSEYAHTLTGIDIHPAATIGSPFFIDHGTGIVIGETSIIGKRVRIYQGVTLGALSLAKGSQLKGTKRHPTVGDDVIIYSGASILGDITIGNNVTIGSNVFLLDSIPADRKVVLPKPELIIKEK